MKQRNSGMSPHWRMPRWSKISLKIIAGCNRHRQRATQFGKRKENYMHDVVITAALRTAVGKFNGAIAKVPASDLGAQIIKALLARSGVQPDQISEVIMGQALTAGVGQNPARQALIRAGLPDSVPGMTIGKVCGSGLKATHLAAQAIK